MTQAAGGPPAGAETVLVVEDDPLVRRTIGEMLRFAGYTVLEAGHGDEALRLCEHHPVPLLLLVTDVVLPGMSGWQLKERVEERQPQLRTLFISGHGDEVREQYGFFAAETTYLQKPFTPETLAEKVRALLERE